MSDIDFNFGDSTEETLIGDNCDNNLSKSIEETGDVAGVGLESNSDVRVTDTYIEIGKNEGEEFGTDMDETLIVDDNNLSGKFEKIAGDDGVGLESNTAVKVTEDENEKNAGQEFGVSMDETVVGVNNDLSGNLEKMAGDGGVVLESNSDVRVMEDEEDEVSFGVSDLVWGKVRSHPWWPGQIFDPSDASEKAKKFSKKDGFLIAYFGDQTFAWNEAAKIRPFREHFVSMEKHSKTETFCHAVDCALGEVSRRVELGLACKCLSEEVYDKIKTQRIVNAGIREESSKREGGDGDFSRESFMPLDLVRYVVGLAKSQCGGTDRLEFVTAQAQLLAFNRRKGFNELPEFQMFGELLGNGYEHISEEKDGDVPLGEEMGIKDGSRKRKRKKISNDSVSPRKREINMSESLISSFVKKRKGKAETYVTDNMMVEEKKDSSLPVTQNQFSNVGKRICSVIPALKDGGNGGILSSGKKRGRKKAIAVEDLSPEEILSFLCVAARGPIKGYSPLRSSVSFLSDMRNLFSLEKTENKKSSDKISEGGEELSKVDAESLGDLSKAETMGELSKEETMGGTVVEGFEDSYWTDRLVVSDTQEQVLFEPETPNGNEINSETSYGNETACVESDPKVETGDHVNQKSDEECNPTALILNFSDIESVPSQFDLNNIFRRYGPLNETGTEVMKKSKRAKVIFKRRSDAETAFSSSGKFSIFGPSLVSYRLHYLPIKQDQVSPAKKRSKKSAKSVEGNDG